MPHWYPEIRAARYAGVGAWEFENRPGYWLGRYLAAEEAELAAFRYQHDQLSR